MSEQPLIRLKEIRFNTDPLDGGPPIIEVRYSDESFNTKRLNPLSKDPVPAQVMGAVQDLVNDRLERWENGDEEPEEDESDAE